jgi:hypothetical protein
MDPFEVRIRFTQHLQHLNASVTSANKAAQYALKYRDMDEDLHSCILEQLERVRLPFIFSPFPRSLSMSKIYFDMGNSESQFLFIYFLFFFDWSEERMLIYDKDRIQ